MCSGASQIGGVPTCHGGGSRFFTPYVYISQRLYSGSRIEWPERPPFALHEFPLAWGVAVVGFVGGDGIGHAERLNRV
jgi:hypothetical protein